MNTIEERLNRLNGKLKPENKIQQFLKEPKGIDKDKHPKFWRILEVQKGLCAVCEVELTVSNYTDVYTCDSKPLGILCKSCNVGLVSFRDNQKLLEKAWSFLQRKKGPLKEIEEYFKI